MRDFVFTSTSCLPGHPDKLCDRISDAIVDACLARDPEARITAECAIASDVIFLVCHSSLGSGVDYSAIAREVLAEVGYRPPLLDPERIAVMLNLVQTAPETAHGDGASNNATLFGYACGQTADLMPAPISVAHRLAAALWQASLGDGPVGPDGQVQVSVEFRDRKPERIAALSVVAGEPGEGGMTDAWLKAVLGSEGGLAPDSETLFSLNPPGAGQAGGPRLHPGLTGRKVSDDTYGDFARQSSSALSGKDARRIERIGAYAARHAAKNVVAAGLAGECEVQLSYTVGLPEPVSLAVDTNGTAHLPEAEIAARLSAAVDFRPAAILERFGCAHLPAAHGGTFYRRLAAFGQMGAHEPELPWERTDLAGQLAG